MNVIQEITSQTADGTNTTASSIGNLASMAVELRESVAGFTLPGDNIDNELAIDEIDPYGETEQDLTDIAEDQGNALADPLEELAGEVEIDEQTLEIDGHGEPLEDALNETADNLGDGDDRKTGTTV